MSILNLMLNLPPKSEVLTKFFCRKHTIGSWLNEVQRTVGRLPCIRLGDPEWSLEMRVCKRTAGWGTGKVSIDRVDIVTSFSRKEELSLKMVYFLENSCMLFILVLLWLGVLCCWWRTLTRSRAAKHMHVADATALYARWISRRRRKVEYFPAIFQLHLFYQEILGSYELHWQNAPGW
jgi:hypothetical protein